MLAFMQSKAREAFGIQVLLPVGASQKAECAERDNGLPVIMASRYVVAANSAVQDESAKDSSSGTVGWLYSVPLGFYGWGG